IPAGGWNGKRRFGTGLRNRALSREGRAEVLCDGREHLAIVVEAADAEVVFVIVGVDEVADAGLRHAALVGGPLGEAVEERGTERGELLGEREIGELVDLELALERLDVGVD